MLVLLSPSKTLDFSDNVPTDIITSSPFFSKEALELAHILQRYSAEEISKLMSISPKLSDLNHQRFAEFSTTKKKPALYAYKGDVYEGFELDKYQDAEIAFANKSLRIISGLYGILKPLDLIVAYRLEMSINLSNNHGKNLYLFWKEKLTQQLNEESASVIINLASQEYSSAIGTLNKPKIDIVFKETYKEDYKIIGIHAKKARGVMANFIIRNKINQAEQLKDFDLNNYNFMQNFSTEEKYVFVR